MPFPSGGQALKFATGSTYMTPLASWWKPLILPGQIALLLMAAQASGIPIRRIVQVIGNAWTPRRVPAFSGEKRVGDPTCYVADCSRLSSLGFLPRISLDEGIAHYVSWFKTVQE